MPGTKFLKTHEVLSRRAVSKTYLYKLIRQGLWPYPIKFTDRSSFWIESESDEVLDAIAAGKSEAEVRKLVAKINEGREAPTPVRGAAA